METNETIKHFIPNMSFRAVYCGAISSLCGKDGGNKEEPLCGTNFTTTIGGCRQLSLYVTCPDCIHIFNEIQAENKIEIINTEK